MYWNIKNRTIKKMKLYNFLCYEKINTKRKMKNERDYMEKIKQKGLYLLYNNFRPNSKLRLNKNISVKILLLLRKKTRNIKQ